MQTRVATTNQSRRIYAAAPLEIANHLVQRTQLCDCCRGQPLESEEYMPNSPKSSSIKSTTSTELQKLRAMLPRASVKESLTMSARLLVHYVPWSVERCATTRACKALIAERAYINASLPMTKAKALQLSSRAARFLTVSCER